uniref:Uncharacterized protein n=1 Tax=Syphacia muris TaxID=451379 RepID=A0A0N5AJG8_9BILA
MSTRNGTIGHNIYTRPDIDIEMGEACSPSASFLYKYFDVFRTRSHNGSSSNSDDYFDQLEAELELIPPTAAPPPHCRYGRLFSESQKSVSNCKQKTRIVVFENEDVFDTDDSVVAGTPARSVKVTSEVTSGRRRCARHISVCVGEVQNGAVNSSVQSCPRSQLRNEHLKQLYVDTGLANRSNPTDSMQYEATTSSYTLHGLSHKPLSKSTFSDADNYGVSRLRGGAEYTGCRPQVVLKSHYSVDSGLDSPISNCALLFKELAAAQIPLVFHQLSLA